MKKDKVPYLFAHKKVWTYLQERDEASKENLKKMQDNNKVLTSDKVELVVETCRMLSNMGLGIDEDTCLLVLNCILSNQIEEKNSSGDTWSSFAHHQRKQQLVKNDEGELHLPQARATSRQRCSLFNLCQAKQLCSLKERSNGLVLQIFQQATFQTWTKYQQMCTITVES